jgi:hypothetical protein
VPVQPARDGRRHPTYTLILNGARYMYLLRYLRRILFSTLLERQEGAKKVTFESLDESIRKMAMGNLRWRLRVGTRWG